MSLVGIVACTSSDDAQSKSAFCDSAEAVVSEGTFDSTGSGVVHAMRDLDTSGLSDADRDDLSDAIDVVEEQIAAFNDGRAPDGWSTEPVANVASRICDVEMTSFHVMP